MIDISVILPTYNHGRFLRQAIESVLAQTYPVREIIVIDDGSTDDTSEVVAEFGDRVRYICQQNAGPSKARNRGIQESSSPWIALLDADDWWLPEKTQLEVEALEAAPAAVLVYSSVYWVLPDGSWQLFRAVEPERLWPKLRYRQCVVGSNSSVLVRKDVLVEAGGYDESLTACEDWDLWVRLRVRHQFVCVAQPISVIRLEPNSLSADAHRMLTHTERIMETTLLLGLVGLNRRLWRRRIRGADLYRAALISRDAGSQDERQLLWNSLVQWPSPLFMPERWLALAQSLAPKAYSSLSRRYKQLTA